MAKELPAPFPLTNLVPPDGRYLYFENAATNAFHPDAGGFDIRNAGWLADASLLAYAREEFIRGKLRDAGLGGMGLDYFDEAGTSCFIMSDHDFAIIAFRGTQVEQLPPPAALGVAAGSLGLGEAELDALTVLFPNLVDTLADANVRLDREGVHTGFHESLRNVWGEAGARLRSLRQGGRRIWFTGHSLGGALATIAAGEFGAEDVQGLYTFGCPRVGGAAFADSFPVPHVRFVHANDLIPRVPPRWLGYHHVGNPVFHITADGAVEEDESLRDTGSGISLPFGLPIPSVIDHAPVYYAAKIWNSLLDER